MNKILNLEGIKKLSKKEQRHVIGSARTTISCCGRSKCRISYPGGSFCEPGRCDDFGRCILY